jgi:hypothetical protein
VNEAFDELENFENFHWFNCWWGQGDIQFFIIGFVEVE